MNLIPSTAQRRRWFEIVISGLIIPTYLQICRIRCWLICFPSNLHVAGFSSCRITITIHSYLVWFLWWLRHGAIGPIEATLFRVNVDWTDFRINTFELVTRLSEVQQLALPFCAFDEVPRLLWSQGFLADAFLQLWSRAEQSETFLLQLQRFRCNMTLETKGNRHVLFLQVWSLWYLVRWNMLCT